MDLLSADRCPLAYRASTCHTTSTHRAAAATAARAPWNRVCGADGEAERDVAVLVSLTLGH